MVAMNGETKRVDWNADEVKILCFAAEMMQTKIKALMRQKGFGIPARDAAVNNLSLLRQAAGKLSGHAASMQFNELAALYGALLLLRDTLTENAGNTGGAQREETAEYLEIIEPMCEKFRAVLKESGVGEGSLFGDPKLKRKEPFGVKRASAAK